MPLITKLKKITKFDSNMKSVWNWTYNLICNFRLVSVLIMLKIWRYFIANHNVLRSRSQSYQTFFFVKQIFFSVFLLLSLAISMNRQYFPMLHTLKLYNENMKKRRNQSLVGLIPEENIQHEKFSTSIRGLKLVDCT